MSAIILKGTLYGSSRFSVSKSRINLFSSKRKFIVKSVNSAIQTYRPECYCLSLHVLTVASLSKGRITYTELKKVT